jgi:hypothetical protein
MIHWIRRLTFTVIALVVWCGANAATKPNVVVILCDDLGYECLSSYGSTSYKTPNLDLLAK